MERHMKHTLKMQLSTTNQTVLALIGNALFHTECHLPEQIDWEQVYEECCHQAVQMLAFNGAKGQRIPADVLQKWRQSVISSAYNNIRVSLEHAELDSMMRGAGIPYVILKGCASALYYPHPQDRAMGDVDFLVRKEDMDRAGKILEEAGFVPWEEEHICHVVYRRPPAHYEMHFEPAGIPYGKAGVLARNYLKDVMEQSHEEKIENEIIQCPSVFHHGLIILLHTSHHFLGEGIGLRHLCDWAMFVASLSEQEFQDIFEEKFRALGVWKFAGILTRAAEIGFGAPHRSWISNTDDDLAEAILAEIFESGNFGNKSQERVYETYLISNRGKGGVGNVSMFRQMIRSLNEVVRTKWPLTKKVWLFLPLGWIYYSGQHFLKIMRGQRPAFHFKHVVSEADQRRKLYKKFRLFE